MIISKEFQFGSFKYCTYKKTSTLREAAKRKNNYFFNGSAIYREVGGGERRITFFGTFFI